jgi:hypothetical protein
MSLVRWYRKQKMLNQNIQTTFSFNVRLHNNNGYNYGVTNEDFMEVRAGLTPPEAIMGMHPTFGASPFLLSLFPSLPPHLISFAPPFPSPHGER